MYLPLVADSAQELNIDVEELAATLLALAVGDEGPRRREDRGGERPQRAAGRRPSTPEGTFRVGLLRGRAGENRRGTGVTAVRDTVRPHVQGAAEQRGPWDRLPR